MLIRNAWVVIDDNEVLCVVYRKNETFVVEETGGGTMTMEIDSARAVAQAVNESDLD